MTYSLNNIVNYTIHPTDWVTLFPKSYSIEPMMNITIERPTTKVSSESNNQLLGRIPITVASTAGFPLSSQYVYITMGDTGMAQSISYNGISGNTLLNCFTYETPLGSLATGDEVVYLQNGNVVAPSIGTTLTGSNDTVYVDSTTGFLSGGGYATFYNSENDGEQTIITYTGIGSDSNGLYISGCSGSTNGWVLSSNGCQIYFVSTNTTTGATLPQSTIYVSSTYGFPSSGQLYVWVTSPSTQIAIVNYTGLSEDGLSFTGCTTESSGGFGADAPVWLASSTITTTISAESNGKTLGIYDIYVNSTDGFATSGQLVINENGSYIVDYTGLSEDGSSFTGCSNTWSIYNNYYISVNESVEQWPLIECYWFVLPQGVPFTTTVSSSLDSALTPFSAQTYGNTASIIAAPTTTIAAGSNGAILPQDTIYVESTYNFSTVPGYIWITISGTPQYINYTGISEDGLSFTGCSGGSGTLSLGDIVTTPGYNAVLTNIEYSDALYITIGNSSSNNNIGFSSTIYISPTSCGFNAPGTVPDSNNGHIIWAFFNYNFDTTAIAESPNANHTSYYISDGNELRATAYPEQVYWNILSHNVLYDNNQSGNEYGLNIMNINITGNLYAVELVNGGSVSDEFNLGIPDGMPFSTVFYNTTSYTAHIGYTADYQTLSGNIIDIPNNEIMFIFNNGTDLFAQTISGGGSTILSPVKINSTNASSDTPYNIIEPSGTTYIVDCSTGTCYINLPTIPESGTQYNFKDWDWTFSESNPLTINASTGDYLQNNPSGTTGSMIYTTPGLVFTLQYNTSDQVWRIISINGSTRGQLYISGSSYYPTDINESDYFVDTSNGPVHYYYSGITPYEGQEISFKDYTTNGVGWNLSPFVFSVDGVSPIVEQPAIAGSFGVSATFNNAGDYVKYRYYNGFWYLIEHLYY
jgi:hypothetical protein